MNVIDIIMTPGILEDETNQYLHCKAILDSTGYSSDGYTVLPFDVDRNCLPIEFKLIRNDQDEQDLRDPVTHLMIVNTSVIDMIGKDLEVKVMYEGGEKGKKVILYDPVAEPFMPIYMSMYD